MVVSSAEQTTNAQMWKMDFIGNLGKIPSPSGGSLWSMGES
jgi:hypothetical protein